MYVPTNLYRVGLVKIDTASHRFIVSETWESSDPEPSINLADTNLTTIARSMQTFWGFHTGVDFQRTFTFWERIYPKKLKAGPRFNTHSSLPLTLNPAAQEACFRLQRVGAAGSIGRVLYPILDDTFFTDIPHRRHIDLTLLTSYLNAADSPARYNRSLISAHYTNVVFNRQQFLVDPVDHYTLLENPVRVWQRWRLYTGTHPIGNDSHWVPPTL